MSVRSGAPPTAEELEASPESVRRYLMELETIADPSCLVRDAMAWQENALALAVRVRELEAELAGSRPGLAQAVPRTDSKRAREG